VGAFSIPNSLSEEFSIIGRTLGQSL